MWRLFWISFGAIASLVVLLIWVSQNVTFLFSHPRTAGVRVEIDRRTGGAVVVTPVAATLPQQAAPGMHPQAVTPEVQFDFGVMDPLTMGKHDFVIRNAGQAPLKLEIGPTTCKCTMSGLSRSEVPPGESAAVMLEWNTGRDAYYAHSGSIQTNDPARKWIEFKVRGSVRTLIGVDQPEIVVERIEPNQETAIERLLYSQIWERFSIRDIESSIAGLTWETDSVDPASVPELNAKSVVRLRVLVPGNLPPGDLEERLQVRVDSPNAQTHDGTVELALQARVLKRIGVYGSAVDERGIVELGTVAQGAGAKVQLIVKVRDADLDLSQVKIEASPAILSARLEPSPRDRGRGLYRLIVELDRSAPPCAYRTSPLGQLRIDTNNAELGVVDLGVSFVVLPRQPL